MAVSQKIATVERRKARLPFARAGGAPSQKVPQVARAVSALRSLTHGEGKEKREALAPRLMGRGR